MTNVIPFCRKNHMVELPAVDDSAEVLEPRAPFSFDMVQLDSDGLVLIDACVPMGLAVQFMDLMERFSNEIKADAPANSDKRRSRKKTAASA